MSQEQLWTVFGIFVGWGLTTATSLATSMMSRFSENRRSTGRLLSLLLELRSQLNTLQFTSESMKDDSKGWQDYERLRKYLIDKHFLTDITLANIEAATSDLAGINPLEAVKIRGLFRILIKAQSTSLKESSKNDELYISLLSMHEVTMDGAAKELQATIQRLAWGHGLSTWMRLRLDTYKRSHVRDKNRDFLNRVMLDLRKSMKDGDDLSAPSEPSMHTTEDALSRRR